MSSIMQRNEPWNDAVLAPGATFEGRYEIVDKLGEGGFGSVHKARQLSTGQLIALKILRFPDHGGAAQTAMRVARFLRETRLCAQLRHPNIVQLIDSGQTADGTLYIAFAFAPGNNLAAVLDLEGALAPREARHLMLQVLDGLACAHAASVVHRDLKPSNIMVIPTGARRNALVLDFGIGVMLDDDRATRLTGSHEGLGTPGYGAPEQWRGDEPSPRADLFSWGLVFLECLTGKPAYAGTAADIFYQLLGSDPVPIPAALAHHPVGEVLARAIAKDPAARDVTARALLDALEACDLRGLSREARLGAGGDLRSRLTGPTVVPPGEQPGASSVPGGERRQLTALCCRVTVHAAEAQGPDREGLDDPLRTALATCAEVGRRHGGYMAAALGDQLLVYFGYPSAAEDDARRGARAALAMAGAVRAKNERSAQIEVSAGIHTGLVIDGDLADLERASLVTGDTPRLAARLAALAPHGSVMVSGASQRLLRTAFELAPDGVRAVEGFAPVETFRLCKEYSDAARPTPDYPMPISGRGPELGLLVERWRRACEGSGQASLITGEPGIGKSRLARALRDRVAPEPHAFLEARCSPDTRNTALSPVVDLLERALGLDQEPDPSGKMARLERALTGHGFSLPESMPLFLPLFSLPLDLPYRPLDVSPPRQKTLTLQAIVSLLLAMADSRPVLLLAEDLHWADPTTMELLSQLVREAPQIPICLVMTARPELAASFSSAGVLLLPLGRLERPQIAEMLTHLAREQPLPPGVIEYVSDRADGVPLFAEELLRMMIDAGLLRERGDRYELTGPLSGAAIPGTLRALLTARLDRLSRAKETAQLAAALGREFSLEVLSAASQLGPAAVADDVERLMSAGLVQRRRRGKEVLGVFKHALVRDAAYESLSAGARQRIHARIASTLEERFPEIVRTRPDLLAHHHAAAEQKRQAVGYARRAAEQGLQRSAYPETIAHALN
ncbi:MAG TPA: TOMM system kinase/cyclase fusion protein, partial [Kofleriaceae bacterium]